MRSRRSEPGVAGDCCIRIHSFTCGARDLFQGTDSGLWHVGWKSALDLAERRRGVRETMTCRLIYLVGQLGCGGLERQLQFLLEGLDRQHYSARVVVWNFRDSDPYVARIRALGIPLDLFPAGYSGYSKLGAFRRLVTKLSPEVVHSYSFYTNFAAWYSSLGSRAIPIGAVQSDFEGDIKNVGPLLGRLSARWPVHQIYNSFAAKENALKSPSLFVPKHIFVVRNGLDLQRFKSVPVASAGPALILGVGSLLQVKRWDRLLAAASALRDQGHQFHVQIAGDGPLRQDLQDQANRMGLAGCVEFLGYHDDIPKLISQATFLVHTSETEGCPNAVMEAMACGRAVVATDVGDIHHLVEEGTTGFVVKHDDHGMLVDRMANLLSNRELCAQMGATGRTKAEREFGLDRLVSETLAAYEGAGWRA